MEEESSEVPLNSISGHTSWIPSVSLELGLESHSFLSFGPVQGQFQGETITRSWKDVVARNHYENLKRDGHYSKCASLLRGLVGPGGERKQCKCASLCSLPEKLLKGKQFWKHLPLKVSKKVAPQSAKYGIEGWKDELETTGNEPDKACFQGT